MNGILIPIHSLIRWVLLLLLLAAIVKSLHGILTKRAFTNSDNKISLFLMISAHTQLLVGILLYFVSPYVRFINTKGMDNETRFFTMEHSVMMILAIVFITIARISSKKAATDALKFRRMFIFNIIALVVIIAAMPMPILSHVYRPWF